MMQNFGLEDLSHVQSRRNLLKYLVRVEMAGVWKSRKPESGIGTGMGTGSGTGTVM